MKIQQGRYLPFKADRLSWFCRRPGPDKGVWHEANRGRSIGFSVSGVQGESENCRKKIETRGKGCRHYGTHRSITPTGLSINKPQGWILEPVKTVALASWTGRAMEHFSSMQVSNVRGHSKFFWQSLRDFIVCRILFCIQNNAFSGLDSMKRTARHPNDPQKAKPAYKPVVPAVELAWSFWHATFWIIWTCGTL